MVILLLPTVILLNDLFLLLKGGRGIVHIGHYACCAHTHTQRTNQALRSMCMYRRGRTEKGPLTLSRPGGELALAAFRRHTSAVC